LDIHFMSKPGLHSITRQPVRCAKSRGFMGNDSVPTDNFKFLVIGAGRGGTSLLAGLLDYHPALTIAYELYAAAFLMGRELPQQGVDILDQRVASFISHCQNKANQQLDTMWGNKITTEQLFGLEDHNVFNPNNKVDVLDAFFNKYLKGIKVVFILRDGRACIHSKINKTAQSLEQAAERWRYSVACYKFFQTRHQNNFCVRFEDLLYQPQETLVGICGFLGIAYQDVMLLGTNNSKMLPEYRKAGFDCSKAAVVELPEKILAAVRDDLMYCNYL